MPELRSGKSLRGLLAQAVGMTRDWTTKQLLGADEDDDEDTEAAVALDDLIPADDLEVGAEDKLIVIASTHQHANALYSPAQMELQLLPDGVARRPTPPRFGARFGLPRPTPPAKKAPAAQPWPRPRKKQ